MVSLASASLVMFEPYLSHVDQAFLYFAVVTNIAL